MATLKRLDILRPVDLRLLGGVRLAYLPDGKIQTFKSVCY